MTALTQDRNTPRIEGDRYSFGVAASSKIFAGSLVVLNGGYAEPGSVATGLVAVGRAEEQVDNGDGQDGDKTVTVRRGVFQFANSASADEITASDIGATCYIVDDQTVAKTDDSSSRSAAGTVRQVDAQGVWVEI